MALAAAATAADARAEVKWLAPEGCSSEARVAEAVARALGRSRPEVDRIDARAVAERAGDGYRVRVAVAGGERTIEARTCGELEEATALVVALAIDPARAERRGPPPAPTAPATAAPPPAPTAAPPPTSAARERGPDRDRGDTPPVSIHAVQVADVGTLPSAAIGAGIGAGLGTGALRLEVGAAIFAGQTKLVSGDAGGSLSQVHGAVKGCYLPTLGPVAIGGCAGVGFDRIAAEGVGTGVVPIATSGTWPALDGEARLVVPLARWIALRLALGAHVPLTRPSFAVTGAGDVHRPGPVTARQSLGLELRFP